jgi:predicted TIM-barrel fold metal-dependent hydrolase
MLLAPFIDCHAHIIDPARFPFVRGAGYTPREDDIGTTDMFCRHLDIVGARHALLVQPSCYAFDNRAILDARANHPGRFKLITVLRPEIDDAELAFLASQGVVGVRFNLVNYDPAALDGPENLRFLARLRELGWFAEIYADDRQWPEVAALLRRSRVKVLIDHFGVRNLAPGPAQPGFAAVLALGREGMATVKLSGHFAISSRADLSDLDSFAGALIAAFGVEGCIWGSDWPFEGLDEASRRPPYGHMRKALERWLPDPDQRARVLWDNPRRILGFGDP